MHFFLYRISFKTVLLRTVSTIFSVSKHFELSSCSGLIHQLIKLQRAKVGLILLTTTSKHFNEPNLIYSQVVQDYN